MDQLRRVLVDLMEAAVVVGAAVGALIVWIGFTAQDSSTMLLGLALAAIPYFVAATLHRSYMRSRSFRD